MVVQTIVAKISNPIEARRDPRIRKI